MEQEGLKGMCVEWLDECELSSGDGVAFNKWGLIVAMVICT